MKIDYKKKIEKMKKALKSKGLCENKGAKDMKCFFGMRIAS